MSGMNNDSKIVNSSSSLHCPEFSEGTNYINEQLSFWVGGVLVCVITSTGILLNLITIFVLHNDSTLKNVFNLLFISLIVNDNISLVLMTFETFKTNLGLHTWLHEILYPYFTLPFINISLTAAIFLTIIIAHERYMATRYPITHRQSLISTSERRKLFSKYILCVMTSTIIINVPKFFEAELMWNCAKYGNYSFVFQQNDSLGHRIVYDENLAVVFNYNDTEYLR